MDFLPEASAYRQELIQTFREMADALASCQREDGFWNVSLHDPSNHGGKELTGTSLFVYGIAWGINNSILDEKYLPIVRKAWGAIVSNCVHPDGFLGYVQGTGKQPSDSQPVGYDRIPNFEDFGLGCFLLAGTEMQKLK
jgi:unsaturated rhamnogalacturonyl hydrolase